MTREKNLKPFTEENAKYYGRKGGIKSGIVRAERKSIKEQMKILLSMPVSSDYRINILKEAGFTEPEINNQLLLTYTIFEKAIKGDVRACEFIMKIIQVENENYNQELSKVDKLLIEIEKYANE